MSGRPGQRLHLISLSLSTLRDIGDPAKVAVVFMRCFHILRGDISSRRESFARASTAKAKQKTNGQEAAALRVTATVVIYCGSSMSPQMMCHILEASLKSSSRITSDGKLDFYEALSCQ